MSEDEKQEKAPKAKDAGKPQGTEEAPRPKVTQKKVAKKLSRMSLQEIEAALENAKEKMGGYGSSRARKLLARREQLMAQSSGSLKKAA